jgi:hypothetical protein
VLGEHRPERMVFLFRHRSGPNAEWEDVEEPIALEWTPCNFGGERPWFLCPGVVSGKRCGRRVAILYGPGKNFLCRHCYDLCYQSQREDNKDRALRRARKIKRRLGGCTNMLEPFPERPKGMHLETYMKLFWEHHEAEMEHLAGMRESRQHVVGARQTREAGWLGGGEEFVRQFLGRRERRNGSCELPTCQ